MIELDVETSVMTGGKLKVENEKLEQNDLYRKR